MADYIEATQAIPLSDYEDETDDETAETERKPCALIKVLAVDDFPKTSYPVYEGINVIGRHGCDINIPLKAMSKEHACIEVRAGSHIIYDRGSRNKTRRAKLFLSPEIRYELRDGDVLTFGNVKCVYEIVSARREDADAGSETGSESMLTQDMLGDDAVVKPALIGEEDDVSEPSSDILQPTQAFGLNTPDQAAFLGAGEEGESGEIVQGESTLYVPDSGSESDVFDESTTRGVGGEQSTLYLEDDSQIHQEDEDDFSATAATQAYTTGGDDVEDDSLVAACEPTQAVPLDEDIGETPAKSDHTGSEVKDGDAVVEETQSFEAEEENDAFLDLAGTSTLVCDVDFDEELEEDSNDGLKPNQVFENAAGIFDETQLVQRIVPEKKIFDGGADARQVNTDVTSPSVSPKKNVKWNLEATQVFDDSSPKSSPQKKEKSFSACDETLEINNEGAEGATVAIGTENTMYIPDTQSQEDESGPASLSETVIQETPERLLPAKGRGIQFTKTVPPTLDSTQILDETQIVIEETPDRPKKQNTMMPSAALAATQVLESEAEETQKFLVDEAPNKPFQQTEVGETLLMSADTTVSEEEEAPTGAGSSSTQAVDSTLIIGETDGGENDATQIITEVDDTQLFVEESPKQIKGTSPLTGKDQDETQIVDEFDNTQPFVKVGDADRRDSEEATLLISEDNIEGTSDGKGDKEGNVVNSDETQMLEDEAEEKEAANDVAETVAVEEFVHPDDIATQAYHLDGDDESDGDENEGKASPQKHQDPGVGQTVAYVIDPDDETDDEKEEDGKLSPHKHALDLVDTVPYAIDPDDEMDKKPSSKRFPGSNVAETVAYVMDADDETDDGEDNRKSAGNKDQDSDVGPTVAYIIDPDDDTDEEENKNSSKKHQDPDIGQTVAYDIDPDDKTDDEKEDGKMPPEKHGLDLVQTLAYAMEPDDEADEDDGELPDLDMLPKTACGLQKNDDKIEKEDMDSEETQVEPGDIEATQAYGLGQDAEVDEEEEHSKANASQDEVILVDEAHIEDTSTADKTKPEPSIQAKNTENENVKSPVGRPGRKTTSSLHKKPAPSKVEPMVRTKRRSAARASLAWGKDPDKTGHDEVLQGTSKSKNSTKVTAPVKKGAPAPGASTDAKQTTKKATPNKTGDVARTSRRRKGEEEQLTEQSREQKENFTLKEPNGPSTSTGEEDEVSNKRTPVKRTGRSPGRKSKPDTKESKGIKITISKPESPEVSPREKPQAPTQTIRGRRSKDRSAEREAETTVNSIVPESSPKGKTRGRETKIIENEKAGSKTSRAGRAANTNRASEAVAKGSVHTEEASDDGGQDSTVSSTRSKRGKGWRVDTVEKQDKNITNIVLSQPVGLTRGRRVRHEAGSDVKPITAHEETDTDHNEAASQGAAAGTRATRSKHYPSPAKTDNKNLKPPEGEAVKSPPSPGKDGRSSRRRSRNLSPAGSENGSTNAADAETQLTASQTSTGSRRGRRSRLVSPAVSESTSTKTSEETETSSQETLSQTSTGGRRGRRSRLDVSPVASESTLNKTTEETDTSSQETLSQTSTRSTRGRRSRQDPSPAETGKKGEKPSNKEDKPLSSSQESGGNTKGRQSRKVPPVEKTEITNTRGRRSAAEKSVESAEAAPRGIRGKQSKAHAPSSEINNQSVNKSGTKSLSPSSGFSSSTRGRRLRLDVSPGEDPESSTKIAVETKVETETDSQETSSQSSTRSTRGKRDKKDPPPAESETAQEADDIGTSSQSGSRGTRGRKVAVKTEEIEEAPTSKTRGTRGKHQKEETGPKVPESDPPATGRGKRSTRGQLLISESLPSSSSQSKSNDSRGKRGKKSEPSDSAAVSEPVVKRARRTLNTLPEEVEVKTETGINQSKTSKRKGAPRASVSRPLDPLDSKEENNNTDSFIVPVARGRRKRRASEDSQTSSSSQSSAKKLKESVKIEAGMSPRASRRSVVPTSPRARQARPHVMFTGLIDDAGQKARLRTLKELGGDMAESIFQCTHLVTDKVRRTVKFLCGVARGIPIVNIHWLAECAAKKTFVDPTHFHLKDKENEKTHKFNLEASLKKAALNPMLNGYKIFVTKSVKPEPTQMKDIIKCAGGEFLSAMPKKAEPEVVVISCSEDEASCKGALAAGIAMVTAEFILTGILRQEVDVKLHRLVTSSASQGTPRTKRRGR